MKEKQSEKKIMQMKVNTDIQIDNKTEKKKRKEMRK